MKFQCNKQAPLGAWIPVTAVVAMLLFASAGSAAETASYGTPIRVETDEVRSLSFVKLVLRPGYTSDVWEAKDNLLSTLSLTFKNLGYNMIGTADEGVFSKKNSSNASMLLAGTVNHLICEDSTVYERLSNCDAAVEWELLDTAKDKVVYKVLTRYRREINERGDVGDEVEALIVGAIHQLLSRERFVAHLKKDGSEPEEGTLPAPDFEAGEFARCPARTLTLPDQMEEAINASALIRVGDGVGSGFYISPDGILLTAAHVVDGADVIRVKDKEGNEYKAEVLRTDKRQDIALLKVDIAGSPCLSLSETLPSIGSDVYAVGAPAGEELAFSVSRGIVSGIREWHSARFIQTDASLNAGNSGGPILDAGGGVIAVVSWKLAIPGFEGLGFGVPSGAALERLAISAGSTTRISEGEEKAETATVDPGVEDEDDPPFSALAVIATNVPKRRIFSYKQRRLWSPGRYILLASAPVMMVAGTAVGIAGWKGYNNATDSHGMFPKEAGGSDTAITEDDFTKYKIMNYVGWSVALTGVVTLVIYAATGKSRERLESEANADARKRIEASADRPTVSVGFSGNGLMLGGRF